MLSKFVRYSIPVLLWALIACSSSSSSVKHTSHLDVVSADQLFRRFLEGSYALEMERLPFTASYRGKETKPGQWNPVSESFQEETRQINEMKLKQLAQFDRSALSRPLQRSYDLYRINLQRLLDKDNFRHHLFIIQQFKGPHTKAASNLINVHTITTVADAEAYIARLNNIGLWFDQVIEQMSIRQSKGMLLTDWQYPQIIQSAKNVISGQPFNEREDSSIWADFNAKISKLELTDKKRETLQLNAQEALLDVVKPAYLRLIDALQKQQPFASSGDGVWRFKGGDAFYAERLRWFTTTDLSAEQIHTLGLEEVARIHTAMIAIKDQLSFDGSLADFFVFMREDPQFYYPATPQGRAEYLADAVEIIKTMERRLPDMFDLLPKADLLVKRVEAFREQSAGKAFYQSPAADGSRPGIYYANLYNLADMPKYQMEAMAYHEGIPGHHMQRAIAVELTSVPEFQKYAQFTAYTEGWGLYSEYLPKEMGFYQDPYSDFGRLAMELWRACRLVVDTGIHSKRWTRKQAVDYLIANTPNSKNDANKAIERYIAMPGQATAYMVGKLKIIALRDKAKALLGEKFSLSQFHDVVLEDGPVPLSMLEEKVDTMIATALM